VVGVFAQGPLAGRLRVQALPSGARTSSAPRAHLRSRQLPHPSCRYLAQSERMSCVNLLKFLGAALVVVPIGGGLTAFFWIGTTTANDANSVLGMLVSGANCGAIALTSLVVLTHLFIRAVRHPWGSQVCPSCLSDVPARASVCRYCQRDLPADVAAQNCSLTVV
jgi:ribosomal protein L40E